MADPITALILGAEFVAANAFAAGVVSAAISVGISYAIGSVISSLTGRGSPGRSSVESADPGVKQRAPGDPANKLPVIYGEQRVKGTTIFADISDDKQQIAMILGLSEGPIDNIGTITWDDFTLSFNDENFVSNAVNSDGIVDDWLNGSFKVVTFKDGGRCPEMEEFSPSKWGSNAENRTLPNVAYVYVELHYSRDNAITSLTQGLTFDIRGKRIRTFADVEGNFVQEMIDIEGTPTLTDSLTYSTNPSECLMDFITSPIYGAGNILRLEELDRASFVRHADFCDVNLPSMTFDGVSVNRKRYECNGFVNTGDNIDLTISDILGCSQGVLNYSQGLFVLLTDKVSESVMSFDDSNLYDNVLVNDEGFDLKKNELTVSYQSMRQEYTQNQVYLSLPLTARQPNEPELSDTIAYKFVNNKVMAERLGTILLNRSRNSQVITINTDSRALELQPTDVITVSRLNALIVDKEYRINSISETTVGDGSIGGFTIIAQEYAASDFDDLMLTEEDNAPNTSFPSPRNVGVVGALTFVSNTPRSINPSITISFIPPSGIVDSIDVYISDGMAIEADRELAYTITSPTGSFGTSAIGAIIGIPDGRNNLVMYLRARNQFYTGSFSEPFTFGSWDPMISASGDFISFGDVYETSDGEPYSIAHRYGYLRYSTSSSGADFKLYGDLTDAEKNGTVYQGLTSDPLGTRIYDSSVPSDVNEFRWYERTLLDSSTNPYYRVVGGRQLSFQYLDNSDAVAFIFDNYSIDDGDVVDTDFLTSADVTATVDVALTEPNLSVTVPTQQAVATLNVNDTPIIADEFYDSTEVSFRAEGFIRGALVPVAEVTHITFSGTSGLFSRNNAWQHLSDTFNESFYILQGSSAGDIVGGRFTMVAMGIDITTATPQQILFSSTLRLSDIGTSYQISLDPYNNDQSLFQSLIIGDEIRIQRNGDKSTNGLAFRIFTIITTPVIEADGDSYIMDIELTGLAGETDADIQDPDNVLNYEIFVRGKSDSFVINLPGETPPFLEVLVGTGSSGPLIAGVVSGFINNRLTYTADSADGVITVTGDPSGDRGDISVYRSSTLPGSTLEISSEVITQGVSVSSNRNLQINGRILPNKEIILTSFITGGVLENLQSSGSITFNNIASPDFGNADTTMNTDEQDSFNDNTTVFDYGTTTIISGEVVDFNDDPIE